MYTSFVSNSNIVMRAGMKERSQRHKRYCFADTVVRAINFIAHKPLLEYDFLFFFFIAMSLWW